MSNIYRKARHKQESSKLIQETDAQFIDVSIAAVIERHRIVEARSEETHLPRQRYYLKFKRDDGETRYFEVLSARLNEFGRYTIETQRGTTVVLESVDAKTKLKELDYAHA